MAMHVREVESLARQVEARESLEPTKLQTMLAAQRSSSDGLSLMYIADRRGISVAVDPPLNGAGELAVGTDSFIDGLGHDPQDTAIVRSVITIAKTCIWP